MYRQTTRAIEVIVEPTYLEDQSRPEEDVYVWSYDVTIANRSPRTVQLLSRHWRVTDARGRTLEVRGPGVVGQQPVIRPGETYTYSSFTNLATPSGIMVGTYTMDCAGETISSEVRAAATLVARAPRSVIADDLLLSEADKASLFEVAIPAFSLDCPDVATLPN